jgi:hypothetical protein
MILYTSDSTYYLMILTYSLTVQQSDFLAEVRT